MAHKNGFTLTEVLLAVMILALIGVALASLTTAASRESSLGNSKIVLRNSLSAALRQIRTDIESSTWVLNETAELTSAPATNSVVRLASFVVGHFTNDDDATIVAYCFQRGNIPAAPAGSYAGGTIWRVQVNRNPVEVASNICRAGNINDTSRSKILLTNVKFIPNDSYQVPLFKGFPGGGINVRLILEVPGSQPVANVAAEEIFFGSSNFATINSN